MKINIKKYYFYLQMFTCSIIVCIAYSFLFDKLYIRKSNLEMKLKNSIYINDHIAIDDILTQINMLQKEITKLKLREENE